ncbi:MAG: acyl carrier protein [Beijerinckiaceae bacterium]|nr:acyl carrier protein [Beijerinckiaceae bacterium]
MLAASQIDTPAVPAESMDADLALLGGFLRQLSPAAKALDLKDDTPLLSSGILDSLGILQLMSFLGEELGIEIADDDFTLDNFETVGALMAFIRRRKG